MILFDAGCVNRIDISITGLSGFLLSDMILFDEAENHIDIFIPGGLGFLWNNEYDIIRRRACRYLYQRLIKIPLEQRILYYLTNDVNHIDNSITVGLGFLWNKEYDII